MNLLCEVLKLSRLESQNLLSCSQIIYTIEAGIVLGDLLDSGLLALRIHHVYERNREAFETRAAQHYLKKNGLVLQVLDNKTNSNLNEFFPDIGPGRGTRQTLLDTEK